MEDTTKPRRRWFRFGLRTLLIVTMFVGFGCALVSMQLQQKRRHEAVVNEILKSGGHIHLLNGGDTPAWQDWIFGSYAVNPVLLVLNNTNFSNSVLHQIRGMNVTYLDLSSTKVTDAGLVQLEGLSGLESLVLTDTEVTDAGMAHLKSIANLQSLNLSDTQISDAGLSHLKGLSHLTSLDITNTQVTDAGLTHLEGITSLRVLRLDNTQITNAGLSHLERDG